MLEVAAQAGACEVVIGMGRLGALALIASKYIVTFCLYSGLITIALLKGTKALGKMELEIPLDHR